jgi:hypothetical protein
VTGLKINIRDSIYCRNILFYHMMELLSWWSGQQHLFCHSDSTNVPQKCRLTQIEEGRASSYWMITVQIPLMSLHMAHCSAEFHISSKKTKRKTFQKMFQITVWSENWVSSRKWRRHTWGISSNGTTGGTTGCNKKVSEMREGD